MELVTDYLEGRMAAAEAERFEAHMGVCPPCLHYLDADARDPGRRSAGSPRSRCRTAPGRRSCTRSPSATPAETAPQRESGAALASRAASTPTVNAWGYFSFSVLNTPAWSES